MGPRARATQVRTNRAVGRSTAPLATADEDDDTSVDAEEPIDPEAPDLQSGGG